MDWRSGTDIEVFGFWETLETNIGCRKRFYNSKMQKVTTRIDVYHIESVFTKKRQVFGGHTFEIVCELSASVFLASREYMA